MLSFHFKCTHTLHVMSMTVIPFISYYFGGLIQLSFVLLDLLCAGFQLQKQVRNECTVYQVASWYDINLYQMVGQKESRYQSNFTSLASFWFNTRAQKQILLRSLLFLVHLTNFFNLFNYNIIQKNTIEKMFVVASMQTYNCVQ